MTNGSPGSSRFAMWRPASAIDFALTDLLLRCADFFMDAPPPYIVDHGIGAAPITVQAGT